MQGVNETQHLYSLAIGPVCHTTVPAFNPVPAVRLAIN
jgi:hypothetical protein